MRQKRIDSEQRAELAVSKPAAAIEVIFHAGTRGCREADFQRYFRVTPPVVHQMIKTLHTHGFIDREPGKARSIKLRLTRAQLPDLD